MIRRIAVIHLCTIPLLLLPSVCANAADDPLLGLVAQVAATNSYKPFSVLVGADDGTTAALGKLLDDPQLSARQRFVAAVALSYVRTPAARDVLLAHSSVKDTMVLRGVVLALGYFRDETGEILKALTQLATTDPTTATDPKTGGTTYPVREGALRALAILDRAQPLATAAAQPPTLPPVSVPATAAASPVGAAPETVAALARPILPPVVTDVPACLSTLHVSGTWQKQPESGGQLHVDGDGRLAVDVPDAGEVVLSRAEPLPEGPWTLNLWCGATGSPPDYQLLLTFGEADAMPAGSIVLELTLDKWQGVVRALLRQGARERNQRLSVSHATGPVQWLQMSYTPEKTLAVRLNGVAMPPWELGPVEMPLTPLTLRAKAKLASTVSIASLTFESYAPIVQPPQGLLNGGWSTRPRKLPTGIADPLMVKLSGFASDSALPSAARVYSLAALALVQCAEAGQVADTLWQQLPSLDGAPYDRAWLLQALPLLLACSSAEQRQAVAPLIAGATAEIKSLRMGANVDRDDLLVRTAFFASQTVAELMSRSYREIAQPRLSPWLEQLAKSDPCTAFSLWNTMPINSGDPRFHAWLSARVRTLIPNYSQLLLERCLAGDHPDDACCRASVELASTDRAAALSLFARIKSPWYRDWTAAALGIETPPVLPSADAAVMERALRTGIASWKPNRQEQTPVKPMLKLAQFLQQQGRKAEATAVVREMETRVTALAEPGFGELQTVLRGMDVLQLPDAAVWTDKVVAAAKEQDAAEVEPAPGSGSAYLSATWKMVRFFLDKGQIDRALALALTLDPETMPMNYNNALGSIIYACADAVPDRILQLLPKLVDERITATERQVKVICTLVQRPAIAAGAWPEQWMALLPADKRLIPSVHLALTRGETLKGDLQARFGEILAGELRYTKPTRGNGWSHRGWALHRLETMPLLELQAYEPYLKDDPDFYCYQLLNTIVRETGLVDDPLWQLWKAPDEELAYQMPWEIAPDQLKPVASPTEK